MKKTLELEVSIKAHLIIGCGYLGSRVADLWLERGYRVAALTRNRADQLRAWGIEPLVGDILQPGTVALEAATVLYAVGLDRTAGKSFREIYIDGLRNVLDSLPTPERFIYVSSTSVYGQTDESIVDESSPTDPAEENGKVVLEAERLLRSKIPGAIILRFAGIYGPDRILRRRAIEKGEPLVGDAQKWLNLIHVEDGARAVLAAEAHAKAGETYLIADDEPVRRRDFYRVVAELLHAPTARFEPLPPGSPFPPHERANRRLSNRRMRADLKVNLEYPEFRSGLRASMGER